MKRAFLRITKDRGPGSVLRAILDYPALLLFLVFSAGSYRSAFSQRDSAAVRAFTSGYEIISISGPGWESKEGSGDLVLELMPKTSDDEPVDFEKLVLLRAHKGKYRQIEENAGLLMSASMLGAAGSASVYLTDSILHVDYNLGSNSSFSRISMSFKKETQGKYVLDRCTSTTSHYGEEDLFARMLIINNPDVPILFSEASEEAILNSRTGGHGSGVSEVNGENGQMNGQGKNGNGNNLSAGPQPEKFRKMAAKMIPEDYQLISFAIGDLNGDALTQDALLLLQSGDEVLIRLLLENEDGSYQLKADNSQLLLPYYPTRGGPIQNIRMVIKNTYFTIEQRLPTSETDYDHRYLTFHYNAERHGFLLHRYDKEHYLDFQTSPESTITKSYKKDFGDIFFSQITAPPNTFIYEEPGSVIIGEVVQKTAGLRAGIAGEKEQLRVFQIQLPFATRVEPPPFREESARRQLREMDVSAVQLLTENRSIDLREFLNKKVQVTGKFLPASSKSHVLPIVFVVQGIELR